jgi:hypothetical protein
MVDTEELKSDKIMLFGFYAYTEPNEDIQHLGSLVYLC